MKRLATAITAVALIGTPAFAADMAVKAPPPATAPVYSWTGWYAGLSAGGGWDENRIDNSVSGLFCNPIGAFCPTPLPPGFTTPSGALATALPLRFDTHPKGFIAGGQIGYNYQLAPNWVAGLETDFQGSDINGNDTVNGFALAGAVAPFIPVNVTGTGGQKLDWLWTLRGRLGWVPTPPFLVYATAGFAYGHTDTNVSFSANTAGQPVAFIPCAPGPCSGSTAANVSNNLAGWTVGGGLEWMFAPHWSIKGEYLHYDLGTVTIDQTLVLAGNPLVLGNPAASVNIHSDARYQGNIVRAAVNYHF